MNKNTKDVNACFTSLELSEARSECKRHGIAIPLKIFTFRYGKQYEVWSGHVLLGIFKAYNASEAKAKYLSTLIYRTLENKYENE